MTKLPRPKATAARGELQPQLPASLASGLCPPCVQLPRVTAAQAGPRGQSPGPDSGLPASQLRPLNGLSPVERPPLTALGPHPTPTPAPENAGSPRPSLASYQGRGSTWPSVHPQANWPWPPGTSMGLALSSGLHIQVAGTPGSAPPAPAPSNAPLTGCTCWGSPWGSP